MGQASEGMASDVKLIIDTMDAKDRLDVVMMQRLSVVYSFEIEALTASMKVRELQMFFQNMDNMATRYGRSQMSDEMASVSALCLVACAELEKQMIFCMERGARKSFGDAIRAELANRNAERETKQNTPTAVDVADSRG
jgi:hypothetical protein